MRTNICVALSKCQAPVLSILCKLTFYQSSQPYDLGTIFTPILQMWKPRPKSFWYGALVHTRNNDIGHGPKFGSLCRPCCFQPCSLGMGVYSLRSPSHIWPGCVGGQGPMQRGLACWPPLQMHRTGRGGSEEVWRRLSFTERSEGSVTS